MSTTIGVHTQGWTKSLLGTPWASVGDEFWISSSPHPGFPGFKLGHEIGLYYEKMSVICNLVVVTMEPVWDPDRVDAEGWQEGGGKRWPWVTGVTCIASKPRDQAPTLHELNIAPTAMHGDRKKLEYWQLEMLRARLYA